MDSADLPPRDEPLRLMIGTLELSAITGGIATMKIDRDITTVTPHVWMDATALVSGTEVEVGVQLHLTAPRARLVAQRLIECAYVAEQATNNKGEPPT